MALCQINYKSRVLDKTSVMNVILPERMKGPFSVCYLLHGYGQDYSEWTRYTNIERYVEDYPLIVVIPDCGHGFFVDAKNNPVMAYEAQIVPELIEFTEATFQTIPERSARVIDGLSMGGYGAIKYAFKFPELFCAAASHSGAPGFGHATYESDGRFDTEMRILFGRNPTDGPDDVYALAEQAKGKELPAMRIDCGTEDEGVLARNREYHKFLTEIGITHEYVEAPGGHTWDYWDRQIQEAIPFLAKALGIQKRQE